MAVQKNKKGSLLNKFWMGNEKSEGYARSTLPSNRFELFWDILKGRFGKLVLVNLLICLFFLPLFALFFLKSGLTSGLGATYPYNQMFGVGYLAPLDMSGFAESINYNVSTFVYLFMPIALIIGAVGLAGGAYIMRNIVWTEGIFVSNDFWHGIKVNYIQMAIVALLYSVVFYISQFGISFLAIRIELVSNLKWVYVVAEVIVYLFLAIYSIMTLHMVTMLVTYEMSFKQLFKNSIILTFGAFPQSLFFFAVGALPLSLCFFGGIWVLIGLVVLFIIGISFFLLIWTNFSQWLYDNLINPKIGAKVNRGIYEKVKKDTKTLEQYKQQVNIVSGYGPRPIKPIDDEEIKIAELPESFNRSDIDKLMQSKQAMYEDSDRYVELHKNDPEFIKQQEANEIKKKEDEARLKRIAIAKKELEKHNKNKK